MRIYDFYKSKLKQHKSFDKDVNISDFWFEKGVNEATDIFFNNGEPDIFGLAVRWESHLGKVCRQKVKDYLLLKNSKRYERKYEGFAPFEYTVIDFTDFTFEYKGVHYNLESFAKSFPTSQISGLADLRGIDLQGIQLDSCIIVNCMFAYADFKDSHFQQLQWRNTNFTNSDFTNARFYSVRMDEHSSINGVNFTNAFINAIDFNDKNLGDNPIKFNKISYWELLKLSMINLFRPVKDPEIRKHTLFQTNSITGINNSELIPLAYYIKWFQHVYRMVHRYEALPFKIRLQFFFEVLFTKYWQSFSVLGVVSLIINLIFSGVYYFFGNDFIFSKEYTFFDCFYYSIVTFTTLGYGDIHPVGVFGQALVILEVLLGYVTLGLFIYLLSKKIEAKF